MTRLKLRKASSLACKENKNQNALTSPDTLTSQVCVLVASCPSTVAGQGEKEADALSLYPTAPRCSVSLTLFIPKFHKLRLF